MTDTGFAALRGQLTEAAAAFTDSHEVLSEILTGLVDDVERAIAEPLEIFPVCHHSPASSVAMIRRLREKAPKVIYLEMCDDMRDLVPELRNCTLPVAFQAFASSASSRSGPLSTVAPLSEASAEYQAMAYAMANDDVELVFVDRSTDHVFAWATPEKEKEGTQPPEESTVHGDSVGIDIGDLRPRMQDLERHLLHHGKVRHWSEWWDQYVERPLVGADYNTYRQVMTLIGSLFRRLTPPDSPHLVADENRERYMWTRMREHLAATGTDPADCLYVCGAAHAVSRVEEFGLNAPPTDFVIPPGQGVTWKYGIIPSSYTAIEAQFNLAPGSVSMAAATWKKALKRHRLQPFQLQKRKTKGGKTSAPRSSVAPVGAPLGGFLTEPAGAGELDEAELRSWCVDIVRLARKNGYLASTADAIAIFETSVLLAGMRSRAHPTPYDFADAAVTCIEKDTVPGRRDVRRLCEILLGGERLGQVGYESLPPLARDALDRLATLGVDGTKRSVQRVLIDLKTQPEHEEASRLLWRLRYLLPSDVVRNIMGACTLDERSIQESWDVAIGRNMRPLIELGYVGVTVEQVLEQRLRHVAWNEKATAATVLASVEDAIVYLDNPRLVDDLGARAVELLAAERTVDDAPEVLRLIRRLLAHYRLRHNRLPAWSESFVTTGYAHYCTLLPIAFSDDDTGIRQVGAMVGFLVTLEGLALSLGCDRSQLEIAVKQSRPQLPAKIALQWATRFQLGSLTLEELRDNCDSLLDSPLSIAVFPDYLSGFVQALESIPRLTSFTVELLSSAFARLPDHVLLPWLPKLIATLKEQAGDLVPILVREAGRTFPGSLPAIDGWTPPWSQAPAAMEPTVEVGELGLLLDEYRAPTDAFARLLDVEGRWLAPRADRPDRIPGLVGDHPGSATALANLIG